VPLVVTDDRVELLEEGELADLAPTILGMLEVPIPADMTGNRLATPA
jgi:2,3-bisphosphoglycerate-independent phosphoglycerate mutase